MRSRCLGVRVPAPTLEAVASVLLTVAKKESLALPPVLAQRVAAASGRNLRRALLMLEATKVSSYPFTEDQALQMPDWELYIASLAKEVA